MKHFRITLCLAVLPVFLGLPTLAADKAAPVAKKAPAVREAKRPVPSAPRTSDAESEGRAVYQVLIVEIGL